MPLAPPPLRERTLDAALPPSRASICSGQGNLAKKRQQENSTQGSATRDTGQHLQRTGRCSAQCTGHTN
ncbi:hypothetical protein, conserved in T. vivax [Trypanosoma vivax Y486]|uniref:Uncharacterized protein n=1 Tax=Trypanosoma vivax (strain Y486) TaxID=1055687 RepID=F9WPD4_TRYVY|nr:hypothetical protein, conserved in T. vivax [Trypanosoma vivax Y486]|eukprot:CCD19411.1 hypothetical protein, conserved in T. vivax [Trypanosoma vivax Y486]